MAFVFSAGSSGPGGARRFSPRRRGVDWRVVALTAVSAVLFIAMLARPGAV